MESRLFTEAAREGAGVPTARSPGGLLLLAAFEPELAPFRGGPFALAACGIGLVQATVGASSLLAQRRPGVVVLVGTAGAYPGRGFERHDVAVTRRVGLADAAVARGEGAFVGASAAPVACDDALVARFVDVGARPATVATTLAITTDDALAPVLSAHGDAGTPWDLEHLEAYGVAVACRAAGVPFVAVLGVANDVGARGRDQWRAHHEAASQGVADVVAAALLPR